MTIDMAQFHQVFFDESFEGLDIMETGLLEMEPGAVDEETINDIFRAAHSIKGGAGTFGFMHITDFTHNLETLLDEIRDGRREVTEDGITVLLESVDVLREMMIAAQEGGKGDEERTEEVHKKLGMLLESGYSATSKDAEAVSPSPAEINIKPIGWHIVFVPHAHLMRTGNDPVRILRELGTLGEIEIECDTDSVPSFAELQPEDVYLSWDIHLMGEVDQAAIREVFEWVEDECDFTILPILPAGAKEALEAAAAEPEFEEKRAADQNAERRVATEEERRALGIARRGSDRRDQAKAIPQSSSIRVDITKIDALINMVGELVITQSMLSLLGENFVVEDLEKLQTGLDQLERHTRDMQESIMKIRMLPISFCFSRFPRLVHDLSSKMGKKIELVMIGENTEVDKSVIEKIGDPLVHLVRNSLDHGIEMPEERLAAGKPETGIIQLKASHRGGNVVIEIVDDGKGLDRDKIYQKALEKGMIDEQDQLSDQQIYELIFIAGFSTADEVSDVSGRGVGMDVVRRNITELGGQIEIISNPGEGCSIIIRLPLTLAILDGQTITVGDETYIIPLSSIVESIQIQPDMINLVAGKGETFRLREQYLPIIRLHEVFGIASAKYTELTKGLLVVVEAEGRHCGVFVDNLLGQQQVVIKSLESNYAKVEGISGATILGDGSVALILDIPGLMKLGRTHENTPEPTQLTA